MAWADCPRSPANSYFWSFREGVADPPYGCMIAGGVEPLTVIQGIGQGRGIGPVSFFEPGPGLPEVLPVQVLVSDDVVVHGVVRRRHRKDRMKGLGRAEARDTKNSASRENASRPVRVEQSDLDLVQGWRELGQRDRLEEVGALG